MIRKSERRSSSDTAQENRATANKKAHPQSSWFGKIAKTGVAFLAVSQGIRDGAARPLSALSGLPMPSGGVALGNPLHSAPALPALTGPHRRLLSDQTWVTNDSSFDLIASLQFVHFGIEFHTEFTDRTIAPGGKDHDEYDHHGPDRQNNQVFTPTIDLNILCKGASNHGVYNLHQDESVHAIDGPENCNCVEIWKVEYGSLRKNKEYLGTIYAN